MEKIDYCFHRTSHGLPYCVFFKPACPYHYLLYFRLAEFYGKLRERKIQGYQILRLQKHTESFSRIKDAFTINPLSIKKSRIDSEANFDVVEYVLQYLNEIFHVKHLPDYRMLLLNTKSFPRPFFDENGSCNKLVKINDVDKIQKKCVQFEKMVTVIKSLLNDNFVDTHMTTKKMFSIVIIEKEEITRSYLVNKGFISGGENISKNRNKSKVIKKVFYSTKTPIYYGPKYVLSPSFFEIGQPPQPTLQIIFTANYENDFGTIRTRLSDGNRSCDRFIFHSSLEDRIERDKLEEICSFPIIVVTKGCILFEKSEPFFIITNYGVLNRSPGFIYGKPEFIENPHLFFAMFKDGHRQHEKKMHRHLWL